MESARFYFAKFRRGQWNLRPSSKCLRNLPRRERFEWQPIFPARPSIIGEFLPLHGCSWRFRETLVENIAALTRQRNALLRRSLTIELRFKLFVFSSMAGLLLSR